MSYCPKCGDAVGGSKSYIIEWDEDRKQFSVDSCRELYEGIPSDSKEFYVAEGAKHAEFPDGARDPLVV